MNDRAVSDVVGYILVFSLVATTVAIVSLSGMSALDTARQAEQVNNGERAFDVLADNFGDIHQEGAPSRATEVSLERATLQTATTATINVSGWDGSGNNFTVERTANTLLWEKQGDQPTSIVYSYGAVIRSGRQGGTVSNRPPFKFGTERTIIPIVQTRTRQPQAVSGTTVRVRGVRQTPTIIFRGDPTVFTDLWMNVTTTHADSWEQYLSEQPETDCSINDVPAADKQKVVCDLHPDQRDELYVTTQPISVEIER